MIANRWLFKAAAGGLLGLAALAASAQNNEGITTWWPDIAQGLIWTGASLGGPHPKLTYDQAVQSCSTLTLDGMSGWRLPTIDQLDGTLVPYSGEVVVQDFHGEFHDTGRAVGGMATRLDDGGARLTWSSTAGPDGKILAEGYGSHSASKPDAERGAFCVRTMEPEIAAIAKAAQPTQAVPSLQELKNIVPVRQAYEAYQQHDYEASLAFAQTALVLSPHSPEAVYAEALSQAGLGHWSEAIAGFTRLKGMDWDGAKAELSWAKNNQKAAASGKTLDPKKNATPAWIFSNPRPAA